MMEDSNAPQWRKLRDELAATIGNYHRGLLSLRSYIGCC